VRFAEVLQCAGSISFNHAALEPAATASRFHPLSCQKFSAPDFW
jgi:hypothetical protein